MKDFLGKEGDRVLLQVALTEKHGRDIKDFSFVPCENEVLLPPNMEFEFQSKWEAAEGLVMVQAKQVETIDPILNLDVAIATGSGAKAVQILKAEKSPHKHASEV